MALIMFYTFPWQKQQPIRPECVQLFLILDQKVQRVSASRQAEADALT
jgi:hypothetical protein